MVIKHKIFKTFKFVVCIEIQIMNLPLARLTQRDVFACDLSKMPYSRRNEALAQAELEMTTEQRQLYNLLSQGPGLELGDVVRVRQDARGLELDSEEPPHVEAPVHYLDAKAMHGRMCIVDSIHEGGAVIGVQYFQNNWMYNNTTGFVVEPGVIPEDRCWLWKSYELVQLPQQTQIYRDYPQFFA